MSALRPGDLIFYGVRHVHHVAMYAGGGMMLESPTRRAASGSSRCGRPTSRRAQDRGRVTEASEHLRALARRLVSAYSGLSPRAALLVGSAARGDSDESSDLDLLLTTTRRRPRPRSRPCGEASARRTSTSTSPTTGAWADFFELEGVQCQTVHEPVATFDRELERYCVELEASEELPKIVMGLHDGLPLWGRSRSGAGARRRGTPTSFSEPSSSAAGRSLPWWYTAERLRVRDTTIWRHDVLVRSAYALIGSLAALNRVWFSTFELKREREYLGRLEVAPPNFADRLLSLFERTSAGRSRNWSGSSRRRPSS
jgi:hypothetical protein